MVPYFFIFCSLFIFNWINLKIDNKVNLLLRFFLFIYLLLFIGLRYEVGGDWYSYLFYYNISVDKPLLSVILLSDPGYMFINWLCAQLHLNLWGVDIISGFIFLIGLFYFIEKLKLPYLAYFISFPYIIMVVAMGYTRQSIALGILMIAFIEYSNNKFFKAAIIILIAALFHKTAILGFLIFFSNKKTLINPIYLGLIIILSFFVFNLMENKFVVMYDVYVGRDASSGGALPRLLMNAITGVIFLFWYKRFNLKGKNLWFLLSLISILLFLIMKFSSTVADRVSLYFLPLQIVVLSKLPYVVKNKYLKYFVYLSIIMIYTLYFLVWILYANHRTKWIPYQNYMFL